MNITQVLLNNLWVLWYVGGEGFSVCQSADQEHKINMIFACHVRENLDERKKYEKSGIVTCIMLDWMYGLRYIQNLVI